MAEISSGSAGCLPEASKDSGARHGPGPARRRARKDGPGWPLTGPATHPSQSARVCRRKGAGTAILTCVRQGKGPVWTARESTAQPGIRPDSSLPGPARPDPAQREKCVRPREVPWHPPARPPRPIPAARVRLAPAHYGPSDSCARGPATHRPGLDWAGHWTQQTSAQADPAD